MAEDTIGYGRDGFYVGKRYESDRGAYVVLSFHGPKMLVQFDDGKQALLSIGIQWAVQSRRGLAIQHLGKSQELNRSEWTRDMFCTLGYLASRCSIYAQVPEWLGAEFANVYRKSTGKSLSSIDSGLHLLKHDANKWGLTLTAHFVASKQVFDGLDFGDDIEPHEEPKTADGWYVSNNAYIWQLLGLGFVLGGKQDVDSIRRNIVSLWTQNAVREAFDAGVAISMVASI